MKHLSRWARQNPMPARFLIALCHLLVIINAIWLGTQLFALNWGESYWLLPISAYIFFLFYLFYPNREKKKSNPRRAYLRRKIHDFGLVLFHFIVIAIWVNNILIQVPSEDHSTTEYSAVFMAIRPNASEPEGPAINPFKSGIRENITALTKWIKQEFRELQQNLKPNKNKDTLRPNKAILIIFTIILGLFLMYLIVGWSCSISCSGNAGLANFVFTLGWIGVIILTTLLIRKILKTQDPKLETNKN